MNFVTELLTDVVRDILGDMFAAIGIQIIEIQKLSLVINQTEIVTALCTFSMLLGAALCVVVVGKQVVSVYGFGTQGDPDQDAFEIVFRLCLTLGVIGGNSFFFTELLKLTNAIAADVLFIFVDKLEGETMVATLILRGITGPFSAICMIGIAIGLVMFALSSVIRAAEITLSKILLPIFAIDMLNSNHEKWNMFIFQYVMSFLSYILQLLCYQMFLYQFFKKDIVFMGVDYIAAIGWLVLTVRAPKWLEKYIYATGTGQALSHGASRLGQVIMFVGMRR